VYRDEDKKILDYFSEKYPEEACGLLVNKRGKEVWIPCENIAENKREEFKIDSKEYLKASLIGDLISIVHSHPNGSPEPSEHDKKASDFLGIPYTIFSLPSLEKYVYTPKGSNKKYTGRDYKFGENDCYSLARDYYKQELDIILPTIPFEDDWWEKGFNYFDDLFENFGGREVSSPKKHDIIIFKVYQEVPNHCGVYLGEDIFLHHAVNRLSCRESLYPMWKKFVWRYIRCKQLD
tara:strand:+ start:6723 stop:7427 length:705 start_codon:yes stop_codon:yes gene_type:complete